MKTNAPSIKILLILFFYNVFVTTTVNSNDDHIILSVTIGGTAFGTVTSDIIGINCGKDCNEFYNVGTKVLLTAIPNVNSTFSSWMGCVPLSNKEKCVVTMDKFKEVKAIFTNVVTSEQKQWNLEVVKKRDEEWQAKKLQAKEEAEKLDNLAKKEAELKQFEQDLEDKEQRLNQLELELYTKYYEQVETTDTVVDTDDYIPENKYECTSQNGRKYIIYVPGNTSKIIER